MANAMPLGGVVGTDSVEVTGVLLCAGLPVTNATVQLMSSDAKGNRALLKEEDVDERGSFRIQGTEKEIAMPDFWIVILHYCTDTRPVMQKKYEELLDSFWYYDSHQTDEDSHVPFTFERFDLLLDANKTRA
ncbi:hypothetical protein AAVH_25808 [Aphelenchoides avenae]|nr:hypothetical protein AAVH_25808 [Aphelenchus avenae]